MNDKDFLNIVREGLGSYPLSPIIASTLKFFLSNKFESLVIVNSKGEVEFLDKRTERFFNLDAGKSKGRIIKEILNFSELEEVAKSGIPQIGKLFNVGGGYRIVSRFPLLDNNKQIIGAIGQVIFGSLDELEKIRKEANQLRLDFLKVQKKLSSEYQATYTFDSIVGDSKEIIAAKELAKRIAASRSDILIQGESGTGKELFSHAIHNASKQSNAPFVRVNCPAIPVEIAESELFGYEQGAFTGAMNKGKPGKFELAEGGTIFLDEIASLPLTIQAKLLRVLQEREVERLGGRKVLKLNFRLISATNTDLKALAKEGKFRSDLIFRLSKAVLDVPSLRDRREDIPIYVSHFLNILNRNSEKKILNISEGAMDLLNKYNWPGNVRELSNILEQSIYRINGGEGILRTEHLPDEIKFKANVSYNINNVTSLQKAVDDVERDLIFNTLKYYNGNKKKTATHLGIQRSVLYLKMKKLGVSSIDES